VDKDVSGRRLLDLDCRIVNIQLQGLALYRFKGHRFYRTRPTLGAGGSTGSDYRGEYHHHLQGTSTHQEFLPLGESQG
jgi:hypothetical protein